jgi:hypothetical protein
MCVKNLFGWFIYVERKNLKKHRVRERKKRGARGEKECKKRGKQR